MKLVSSCLLLATLLFVSVCYGKYQSSQINDDTEFAYLGKFCYDTSGDGTLLMNITAASGFGQIVYYDDEDNKDGQGSWKAVYGVESSCQDKVKKAKTDRNGNLINTTIYSGYSGSQLFTQSQRAHYWFVAAAFCGGTVKGLKYQFRMFQSEISLWQHEFSYDEQGLEGLYLFYFLAFLIGLAAHIYAVFVFMRAQSYHPVVKLLTTAIVFEFLSVLALFIHYVVYAHDGVGVTGLKGIGDLLDIIAQLVFVLLLIFVANGWCITKMHINNQRWVFGGLGLLTIAYVIMFIWGNVGVDPATNLYIYDSTPGALILVVRGIAMIWFAYTIRQTYYDENHPTKKRFYIWFGVAFTLWFLLLPVTAFVGFMVSNSPWVIPKIVMTLYVTETAIGFAILGYLLWPSHATEYFQISTSLDIAGTIPYEAI